MPDLVFIWQDSGDQTVLATAEELAALDEGRQAIVQTGINVLANAIKQENAAAPWATWPVNWQRHPLLFLTAGNPTEDGTVFVQFPQLKDAVTGTQRRIALLPPSLLEFVFQGGDAGDVLLALYLPMMRVANVLTQRYQPPSATTSLEQCPWEVAGHRMENFFIGYQF